MGLVSGYETIKSKAYYHVRFECEGQTFIMPHSLEDPKQTLKVVKALRERGFLTNVSRSIVYDSTKTGYKTRDPEHETLTFERLEEIVSTDEKLPEFEYPRVVSSYRC